MPKEEKPLEYQRRIRDTKGVAQRLNLEYLKQQPLLLVFRKQITWILLGLAVVACVPLVLGLTGSARHALSTGPLSSTHAVFEARCEVCHSQAFSRVKDEACERCHNGAPHPAKSIDNAKARVNPLCAECHVEHRGEVRLTAVTTQNCTRCHANLKEHVEDVKTLSIKDTEISAFREKDHPEFSTAALKDDRPFKLNHLKHMKADPKKFPTMKLPMKCVDCHKTDTSSPTYNLLPMTFEASCKSCHRRELEFDRYLLLGSPAPMAPHTRDQNSIREFIRNSYEAALKADPSLTQRSLGRNLVISNPAEWLKTLTEETYDFVFSDKCTYCHVMESQYEVKKVDPRPPQSPTAPVQAPLGILGRYPEGRPWLQRAEFSHRAHRELECESCHSAAPDSQKTEDVLIPVMKSCLPCHGKSEARADLDRCSECHVYHNRSKEEERERRPTKEIIGSAGAPGQPFPGAFQGVSFLAHAFTAPRIRPAGFPSGGPR